MTKRKSSSNRRGKLITKDRSLQILNNVFEEYLDHGVTSFATKEEFCEAIMQLNGNHRKEMERKDAVLDAIMGAAIRGRMYMTDEDAKKAGMMTQEEAETIDETFLGLLDPDLDSR